MKKEIRETFKTKSLEEEIILKYPPIKESEKVFINGLLHTKDDDIKLFAIPIINIFYNYKIKWWKIFSLTIFVLCIFTVIGCSTKNMVKWKIDRCIEQKGVVERIQDENYRTIDIKCGERVKEKYIGEYNEEKERNSKRKKN